jgi:DNA ligase-1
LSIIKKPMLSEALDPNIGVQYPVLASPKLDGIRCLQLDGRTLSRKFLDIPNHHVRETMRGLPEELDGELMVEGASFNEVQSAIMSEGGKPDFRYHVFDYVSTSLTRTYAERIAELRDLVLPSFCIKVMPKLIMTSDELDAYEQECLDKGYEGIMVRAPNGPYKCGRATARQGYLLKVKRFSDSEAEVVGFEELMHNENEATKDELGHTKRSKALGGLVAAGTLGKLIVREIGNTPWKGSEFGIGTGFDAQQRQQIWDNRASYLGKIVTYKYQPHGMKDLPRLPVWKGFRSLKDM